MVPALRQGLAESKLAPMRQGNRCFAAFLSGLADRGLADRGLALTQQGKGRRSTSVAFPQAQLPG